MAALPLAAGRSDAFPPDPSARESVGRASPAVSCQAPVEPAAARQSDASLPDASASEHMGTASGALSAQVECRPATARRSDASPPDPSASEGAGVASAALSDEVECQQVTAGQSGVSVLEASASRSVNRASAAFSDQIESRLSSASREAKQRVQRITVPCLLVGTLLLFFGVLLRYMAGPIFELLAWWWRAPAVLIIGLGIISMMLAVVPTQIRSIWFVTGGFTVLSAGVLVLNAVNFLKVVTGTITEDEMFEQVRADVPRWYMYTALILRKGFHSGVALLFVGCVRLIRRRPPPRQHLDELWIIMAGVNALTATQYCLLAAIDAAVGCLEPEVYLVQASDAPCFAFIAVLTAWPGLRVRVQAWLAMRGSHMSVAAAVGALVSLRPLDELLPLVKRRFRCVPLDRITRAMMAGNKPDAGLAALSEPARLGKVDAFLSHSWSDDEGAKWEQLQGETYLTRLWCLLEVFTFIVMGGSAQNLEVRQLRSCSVGFDSFDARKATCFNDCDKSHLLGIIETGLGTMEAFNSAVRDMVGKRPSLAPTPAFGAGATEPPDQKDGQVALDDSDEDLADALDKVIVIEDEEMFSF